MKIGIDISQVAYPGTGVARYVTMLVNALLKYDVNNEYIFFYSSLRQPFPHHLFPNMKAEQLRKYIMPPTFLDTMWNSVHRMSIERLIGKMDIFFTSDWVEPPAKNTKKVTTLHDLTIFRFPETYRQGVVLDPSRLTLSPDIIATQKRRLHWVKKESQLIICDSETTKRDAMQILQFEESRLKVIYPGVELQRSHASSLSTLQTKYKITKNYVLSVGKIEPRKNIKRLIEAYKKANIDSELLIVGAQGWNTDQNKNLFDVKFLGYIPEEDLYGLYKHCEFFIYPSLYEGFGYPVVEAMHFGAPIATSSSSSLAEIAKGHGLLFDPESVDDIAATIRKLADNEKLRRELSVKSLLRYKNFSLKHFAAQLIEVFTEVTHNP